MRVETRRQFMGEKGHPVRFMRFRRLPDRPRKLPEGPHELPLALVSQEREVGMGERLRVEVKIVKHGLALPQDAAARACAYCT